MNTPRVIRHYAHTPPPAVDPRVYRGEAGAQLAAVAIDDLRCLVRAVVELGACLAVGLLVGVAL
jgi:hypothetical protein